MVTGRTGIPPGTLGTPYLSPGMIDPRIFTPYGTGLARPGIYDDYARTNAYKRTGSYERIGGMRKSPLLTYASTGGYDSLEKIL